MFINDAVVCMRLALIITTGLLLGVYKSVVWVVGGCVQVYSYNCTRC